jgi:hypothetical protein
MAHERIEVDLPLAKVYELLCNPVHFPKFLHRIDRVDKVNSQTFNYVTEIGGEEFQLDNQYHRQFKKYPFCLDYH